ncbi:histidinol-phosphate transaminase [Candidatus Altiarchaeota archaeon]
MIKPRKAIQRMKPYVPPLEGRRGKLRLDFNENTLGCSPKALKAVRKLSAQDFATYPEYALLRKKLASSLKVKPDEVIATNATDEAIKLVMDTYVEKGDEVILPVPTFAMFQFYIELADAKVKKVLYKKDLSFPTKKVLKAITRKTRVVVLVDPNNPTGTPILKKDIEGIVKKAKKTGTLVLLDEAYVQFSGKTSVRLVRKYDNLVVIQTFSKAYGLAGLRLGVIVSDKSNIANMSKAASPYSVNVVTVAAGIAALEDKAFVKRYVKENKESKKILLAGLEEIGIKTFPSTANFVLADLGKKCMVVERKLEKKGILVRDRSQYPLLKGCLRITIGSKNQTRKLLSALNEILG